MRVCWWIFFRGLSTLATVRTMHVLLCWPSHFVNYDIFNFRLIKCARAQRTAAPEHHADANAHKRLLFPMRDRYARTRTHAHTDRSRTHARTQTYTHMYRPSGAMPPSTPRWWCTRYMLCVCGAVCEQIARLFRAYTRLWRASVLLIKHSQMSGRFARTLQNTFNKI